MRGMREASGVITTGLTSAEAAARLAADGRNELPPPRRPSAVQRFAHQLVHFFALMLWVASGLALLARLPELSIAIAAVVLLNAVFAFVQEHRADRAAERLQGLLPMRITVRRDRRRIQIDAAEVVVGDVLVLESGDRIPADATVIAANGFRVDTSLLTGESEPVALGIGDEVNAATFVVEGDADAVTTATGGSTRLAEIAKLTTSTARPPSPLTLQLHGVVRTIAGIAVVVGGLFFVIALLLGNPASEGFVFAIGVTVALVPEALLPTVTLSLAWGAEQMAKRHVLVRNLDAVETLGSTTFICTDKTGTLTRNQMTVVHAWTASGTALVSETGYSPTAPVVLSDPAAGDDLARLATAAVRCSAGYVYKDGEWRAHGDPMEAALDVFARRLGLDTSVARARDVADVRFPFDPRRRRASVVIGPDVLVKGAPDAVLPLCVNAQEAAGVLDELTGRGLRVLAVAGRTIREGADVPTSAADAESNLDLLGLVAMEDPPRHDVAEAIQACRRAGVKVAMITGDHPATAAAIATEVGLRQPDGLVLTGDELPADDAVLGAQLDRDGVVIARVSPEQKLRIAQALRARGHVVAMTGDGVNDGPALREADIGIAMGASGTDVAREAADLVLLDDHFASIVAGIEQGRTTFLNIRRFLTYHLTDNVAELTPFVVWAMSGGRIPLALGVLQILALDIGTDTLSAVALGAERPGIDVLSRPPVTGRLLNGTVLRRAFGILGPTEATLAMAAFFISFATFGWRPGDAFPEVHIAAASGAAFMTVVFAQTANAFACRSATRWPGALGWTANPLLIVGASVGLMISFAMLLIPPIADEIGQAAPPAAGWMVAAASVFALLAVDALVKHRHAKRNGTGPRQTVVARQVSGKR
ncbi:MAG: cation-translocating P-type ATPase [Acidimicrobiia bacterium]